MKVYRGKAIITDFTEDDMLISFYDVDEAQDVSVLVPRELLSMAKHVCAHRSTTVVLGHEFELVGMDQDDDDLVDV